MLGGCPVWGRMCPPLHAPAPARLSSRHLDLAKLDAGVGWLVQPPGSPLGS